jgi:hypothetical protein
MSKLPLTSRADFVDVLDQTLAEVNGIVAKGPGFGPFRSIADQLANMKSQTAKGRDPTEDERDAVTIGLIAVRELEPTDDAATGDLIDRLHELNGYFREWPDP